MATNINNYTIGKGIVSIKNPFDTGAYVEVGNVSKFAFKPELEVKEHYDFQAPVKTLDKKVPILAKGSLTLTMDEITSDNLALVVFGTNGGGTVSLLTATVAEVAVKIVGTGAIGNKYSWEFLRVFMQPQNEIQLISDDWMELELTGEVLRTGGVFGTAVPL